eukprot:1539101-Pleurochrysis_carterae.AAC.1
MRDFDDSDDATRCKGKVNGISEQRKVGYFHQLPTAERKAAVLAAMQMRADARVEARADIAEQQDYVKHERAQASERQLAKLAAEYTEAMAGARRRRSQQHARASHS